MHLVPSDVCHVMVLLRVPHLRLPPCLESTTVNNMVNALIGIQGNFKLYRNYCTTEMQKIHGWKWYGMSHRHFLDLPETILPILFRVTPYRYVWRTGKDQGHGHRASMAQFCYLII